MYKPIIGVSFSLLPDNCGKVIQTGR